MPYIKSEDYVRAVEAPAVPGDLNYAITMKIVARLRGLLTFQEFDTAVGQLVTGYLDRVDMSYTSGNAVMGVLDCAAREVQRRVPPSVGLSTDVFMIGHQLDLERKRVYDFLLAPYEDKKIAENGDVYPEDLLNGS